MDRGKSSASKDPTIEFIQKHLEADTSLTGTKIGQLIAEEHSLSWTKASKQRSGAALKKWTLWVIQKNDKFLPTQV